MKERRSNRPKGLIRDRTTSDPHCLSFHNRLSRLWWFPITDIGAVSVATIEEGVLNRAFGSRYGFSSVSLVVNDYKTCRWERLPTRARTARLAFEAYA